MLDMAQPIQMLLKDLLFQNKTNVIAPLYFSFKPAPNRFFERFKVKNSTSEEEIIHEGKVIFSHKREFLVSLVFNLNGWGKSDNNPLFFLPLVDRFEQSANVGRITFLFVF